ncbi:ribonuclease H [Senna tora]|uniref:Ribonuclease H n=1 Tax=Senna tora TaxID=362788 RepID=A0A834SG48_9FABA|nr:ribonuclease H [Senna tora]
MPIAMLLGFGRRWCVTGIMFLMVWNEGLVMEKLCAFGQMLGFLKWDWARFDFLLPAHVCRRIAVVSPPSITHSQDMVAWKHSNDGWFSIKSAYQSITGLRNEDINTLWRKIWRLQVPQRVKSFLWLCVHNKLLTNEERAKRGMTDQAGLIRSVKWNNPEDGWVKVNVNGSSNIDDNMNGACGGVVRDHLENFIVGFARNLGNCSSNQAEVWGVLSGLEIVWRHGFRRVVVEMDSLITYGLVQNQVPSTHPCFFLIVHIRQMVERDWEVQFKHTYREGNDAADAMASYAHSVGYDLSFLELTPVQVTKVLDDDSRGAKLVIQKAEFMVLKERELSWSQPELIWNL